MPDYRLKIRLLIICISSMSPLLGWAQMGETPVSQGLGYIITALTGATGITIATLAIMAAGLMCLFHKAEWKIFGYTIASIALVFGATTIVNGIHSLVK